MSNNLNISCDISPWSKAIKGYWICVSSLCKSWRRTIGSMPSSRLLWILSLSRSIGSRRPTDSKISKWHQTQIKCTCIISNSPNSTNCIVWKQIVHYTITYCCTCTKPYHRRYEKNSKRKEPCELVSKIKARPSGSGFVTFAVKLACRFSWVVLLFLCLFTPGQRKSKLPQAFARNSRRRCTQQLWHVLLSVDKSSQPSKQNLAFYFCNSVSGFTAGASKKRKEAYFVAALLLRFTFFFQAQTYIKHIT